MLSTFCFKCAILEILKLELVEKLQKKGGRASVFLCHYQSNVSKLLKDTAAATAAVSSAWQRMRFHSIST